MSKTTGYIAIPSAARTTAQTFPAPNTSTGFPAFTNEGFRGIKVVFDVTAGTSGFSVTLTIKGYDRASGKSWTLVAGAAVSSAGTAEYTVYPGLAATTNVSANDVLPNDFQITVAVGDAKSVTYSIGAHLLK